MMSAISVN